LSSWSQAAPAADAGGTTNLLGDADYLRSILGSLPGVDPNDPALQSTLRDLQVRTILSICLQAHQGWVRCNAVG